ncbi:MAG: alanine--tRNA ligase, partial [Bryobacteraceae bacterium]
NKDVGGTLSRLPRPSIDTGMGLERVAAIMQGKLSNYETDLIEPVMRRGAELFGIEPGADGRADTALRINADHARAATFLIHDGVLPSNEGRGYVLRKIMRRAMRHARMAGMEEPYLYKLAGFVAEWMRPAYPELMESVQRVARVVKDEEHRYATTFLQAEKMFADEVKALARPVLPGPVAFKLYDTYGLALDEQEEIARERGISIDRDGFDLEMQRQRERARASWKGAEKGAIVPAYQQLVRKGKTKFLGYEQLGASARVVGLLVDKQPVDNIGPDTEAEIVLDQTPFYAETGGQVGDQGSLYAAANDEKVALVETVFPGVPGLAVHRVRSLGPVHVGDAVRAEVESPLRLATMRNHTATHLLHAALRQVLGTHVKQAGSVVEPPRLRFDFTHYSALDRAEIEEIERLINDHILRNTAVDTTVMPLEQAIATGAMALFGEKYGDQVRVVAIPDFSKELCGGTHVRRTGDIGLCKIVSEGSISAGVRRIEAITGDGAMRQYQQSSDTLHRVAQMLRAGEPELVEQVERMLAGQKALEREIGQLKEKLAQSAIGGLEQQARTIKDVKVLAVRIDGVERPQLRTLADTLRNRWKTAVVVLASTENSNVSIVSAVTKDLTAKVHAGKLAGAVAEAVGGKGGGRPDMAEAGGKDPAGLAAALEDVYKSVESLL